MIKLLPCPFCGCIDIAISISLVNLEQYIECNECFVEVKYSDCIRSAIGIWNKRTEVIDKL
jgi:Lar family restriction alleviation protein